MFINKQILSQTKQVFSLRLQPLFKYQRFYILGIFSVFAILHLHIVSNHPVEGDNISFYVLYWLGILFLLWQNQQQDYITTWFSNLLGLGLTLIVIIRPLHLWSLDLLLFRFGPVVAVFGLGLLSFGFSGIKYHWRLFLLLCLMLSPYGFINEIFAFRLHFSELTATISAFSLHYLGLKATARDAFVTLPTGQVEVLYYCTGGLLILWLLKLTLLIMIVIIRLTWQQRLGLISCAVFTGFIVGCIRVALLAVVVNNHNLFEYWHSYTGGALFMALATITYAALCNWILPLELLYSTEKDDTDTKIIVNHQRILFLVVTLIGIILTNIYLITTGRSLDTFVLPDSINLNSWQQVKVKSWSNQKSNTPTDTKAIIVRSQKDYSYVKNNQHLELQMRYFTNTRGESNPFLEQTSANQKNIRYVKGVGYYLLYSDAKQTYLTACINPRGGSTVTSTQFMQNRYTYDLTWSRIVPWIFGKEILRDNRCIWAQLSIPLNEVADTEVYAILESFWVANYANWQSIFLNIN
ncbi:cyanoexosortase A system-associated protein [Halotia branconii]|uniref:Cyanoexosortase A system-associated protein n=1 Tax=Halotia branconii CENA392 TaxID=1539056 RepID=A0AAJ6NYK1_9CYAN|nr:cyanoexosortase A system-associated protein [Halotia branconii]WGV28997.1 cyanoexosortase A system-associated protein [Halotia branconii CENA392]